MKSIICLLLITAALSHMAVAQKITANKVPAAVMSAFEEKFATAEKVTWEIESSTEFEASFTLNGEEVSATFDPTGKWLGTETEIKASALPANVLASLKKDFAGFDIEEANRVESLTNGSCFKTEIERGDETFELLLSADGKVISKVKEEEEADDDD